MTDLERSIREKRAAVQAIMAEQRGLHQPADHRSAADARWDNWSNNFSNWNNWGNRG